MKVLIALDGQPYAEAITNYVCQHRWPAGTQFLLVHVIQTSLSSNNGMDVQVHSGQYAQRNKLLQDCGNRIKKAAPDCEFISSILAGDPSEELLAACRRIKPDLLVIGSHGESLYVRRLLGSVSHALVNHVDCSTMIVRLPKRIIDEWSDKQLEHPKVNRVMQIQ